MTRPSFRQIGSPLEVSDAALERLNEDLRVPTLVKSADRSPQSGQNLSQEAPKPAPRPSPSRRAEKRTTESAKARPVHPEVRLAVNVPIYLRDAVNLRAAQERSTSRHIVMQGLLALGFEIDPADLVVDGRQPSGKR
jgi:hypothetical protein